MQESLTNISGDLNKFRHFIFSDSDEHLRKVVDVAKKIAVGVTVITDPGTAAREYAQQARALNQLGDTAHDPDGYALHARGWVQGGGAFVVLTGRIGVGLFHEEYHRLYGAPGQ